MLTMQVNRECAWVAEFDSKQKTAKAAQRTQKWNKSCATKKLIRLKP